jgi:NitT/TauT family transport system substrate-binding protein
MFDGEAVALLPYNEVPRYEYFANLFADKEIVMQGLTRSFSFATLILLLTSLLAACGQTSAPSSESPSAGSTTVRLGYFPNLTHAAALVAVERGSFQEALGSNVTLDIKTFNAGPSAIEAMFAGELDITYIGPNPAINGYVKSNGEALRIIAGATSAGALFIVRPEANIASAADLDGKKLATPQLGNTQDVALRAYLIEHGLNTVENGGSVTIVPTQNPDILTLFQKGEIDGAWVPEPWGTRLIQEANGTLFLDEKTLWPEGKFVTTHIIVSAKFLNQHPDLVKAFLSAHVSTVQFINENPDQAKTIVNSEIERITGKALPEEVLNQAYSNLEITYDPVTASLFKSAEDAYTLGYLGDKFPDLSAIYALETLNSVLQEKDLPEIAQP